MGYITSNTTQKMDGSTTIVIGQDIYEWSGNLDRIDVSGGFGDKYRATFEMSGENWYIGSIEFSSTARATFNDNATMNTRIARLIVDNDGFNSLNFNRTYVDYLLGSEGVDTVRVGRTEIQMMNLAEGNDVLRVAGGYVGYANLGWGNDTVFVSRSSDLHTIVAGIGNDRVELLGGSEVETISMGDGLDTVISHSDKIGHLKMGDGVDVVMLGVGGAENINLGRDNDAIFLSRLQDRSYVVRIDGGTGVSDPLLNDFDIISFYDFKTSIDIDLTGVDLVDTKAGIFVVSGFESVRGGGASDHLTGNSKDNVVSGNGGNDFIAGGRGKDELHGGDGKDTFVFGAVSHSARTDAMADTISDFVRSEDIIDLSGIDANSRIDGNQAFTFVGQAPFSGVAGEIRYSVTPTDAYVYGDVNGDRRIDFAIHISDVVVLREEFFVL